LGPKPRRNSFETSDGRLVTLRSLNPLDTRAILEFANALYEEKRANRDLGLVAFDRQPTVAEEREFLSEIVRGRKRNKVVSVAAFHGKRLVGHCDIRRGTREDVLHAGTLGIAVLRGYRGVGIGEKLMNEALMWARQAGIWLVQLTVFANNSVATGLYRKTGFRKAGVIPNKMARDGRHFDEVIMYVDLRGIDKSTSRGRRKS